MAALLESCENLDPQTEDSLGSLLEEHGGLDEDSHASGPPGRDGPNALAGNRTDSPALDVDVQTPEDDRRVGTDAERTAPCP
jgi:hypothetical protein